jgi:hypothetical protein
VGGTVRLRATDHGENVALVVAWQWG